MFKTSSWKTTLGGIAGLLAVIAKAINEGKVDMEDIVLASNSAALLFARDNDKTSEDVNAK